jgi:hypothetical protein
MEKEGEDDELNLEKANIIRLQLQVRDMIVEKLKKFRHVFSLHVHATFFDHFAKNLLSLSQEQTEFIDKWNESVVRHHVFTPAFVEKLDGLNHPVFVQRHPSAFAYLRALPIAYQGVEFINEQFKQECKWSLKDFASIRANSIALMKNDEKSLLSLYKTFLECFMEGRFSRRWHDELWYDAPQLKVLCGDDFVKIFAARACIVRSPCCMPVFTIVHLRLVDVMEEPE